MTEFEIEIEDRWFNAIRNNQKQIEGKHLKNADSTASKILKAFKNLEQGQKIILIFKSNGDEERRYLKTITEHVSIQNMLETYGIDKVLPGVKSIEEGKAIYANYYSLEHQATGVIALVIESISESILE